MSDAVQSLTGTAGLAAWILVLAVVIGVVYLMRFLVNHDGAGMGIRQLSLIVLASVLVLVLAGGGGLLLLRAA
ncbi:MAG TPA: hypothetical protein VE085_13810 [Burkholderiales bacterium]|nr:hypothetical protein [Burkholderiales bacterium]